jgi:hypothetical protein
MRTVTPALLLVAAACGTGDNVVIGGVGESSITPVIQFENIRSVISGRVATLINDDGTPTNISSQVIIISDRSGLCDRLAQHPDYFRSPPELYVALILFLPPTNHLGTFLPGRPGDEGTGSEIIGIKDTSIPVAPFRALNLNGYIALRDWSETAGGESSGSFNLLYAAPEQLNVTGAFPFYGKFKASFCPALEGTLLP